MNLNPIDDTIPITDFRLPFPRRVHRSKPLRKKSILSRWDRVTYSGFQLKSMRISNVDYFHVSGIFTNSVLFIFSETSSHFCEFLAGKWGEIEKRVGSLKKRFESFNIIFFEFFNCNLTLLMFFFNNYYYNLVNIFHLSTWLFYGSLILSKRIVNFIFELFLFSHPEDFNYFKSYFAHDSWKKSLLRQQKNKKKTWKI